MKRLLRSINAYSLIFGVATLLGIGLRVFLLGKVPMGYTLDEVAIAYDGWSIAEWGVDLFLHPYPKVFQSLGDYKAPVMIYLSSWIFRVFGYNLLTVRVLSAIAGILLMPVVYGLAKLLFRDRNVALLTMFLMALSPWSLQLSRVGFEANLALLFMTLGVFLLLKARKQMLWFPLSGLLFAVSVITYHSQKIIVPILLMLGLTVWKYNHKRSIWWWMSLITCLVIVGGFFKLFVLDIATEALGRGKQTTVFYRTDAVEQLGRNLVKHLDGNWWVGGKQFSLRHGVPGFGVLMWVELPLLAVGFFGLLNQRRVFVFLMGWIIIGLLPSIISVEAPHALRASAIIPPLMLVVGYGGITLLQITKSRFGNKGLRFTGLLLLLMYVTQYTQYVNTYYTTYAQASAIEFQFGMSEAAIAAQEYLNKGDRMVMTTVYGDPKYHVLTALGISPANFQAGSIRHMEFKPIQWPTNEANVVFVGTPTEIPITGDRVKTTILIPGTQTVVFVIAKT